MDVQREQYLRSREHDRYIRTLIRTIAVTTKAETGQPIPGDVMAVGDDWAYIGKVSYFGNSDIFQINPVDYFGIIRPVQLSQVIEDHHPQAEVFSLIPDGESRMEETRRLGKISDKKPYSFTVRTDSQEIRVYRMRDVTHAINDNTGIGITTFH